MCGLPVGINVVTNGGINAKAAIVINDLKLELMCVEKCTNEYGICVWLRGDFGELHVVSVYCWYDGAIEPYLEYIDRVGKATSGKRVLTGIDVNAISPLWFSKKDAGSRAKKLRGRMLEDWITGNGMIVLNEPCKYTFSGPNKDSNINVTLMNEACAGCHFE